MKKADLEVGKLYANKAGTRFRLITDEGETYCLAGSSQTDRDAFQYLQVIQRKAGPKFEPGGYDAQGRYKPWDPKIDKAFWGQCTRTSLASWAKRLATAEEEATVRTVLKQAGLP